MHNRGMTFASIIRVVAVVGLATAAIIVATPVLMRLSTARLVYPTVEDAAKADAALVLGASVARGQPSPVLEKRAHTAVQLYIHGKVKKILVTGDNGALSHDEVTPVRKYLLSAGVKPEDIFLDHAGFDTYSSMYRARDVFEAHSIIIVTQDFHMPRAIFIARHLGLEAYGIVAEGRDGDGRDYLREIPASVKAAYDIVIGRLPKYLGDRIPLTGDGSVTWY